jgi:hypothetical protein
MLSRFFRNGTEYEERYVRIRLSKHLLSGNSRLRTPFSPPNVTLKEVHDAVPKDLLRRRILCNFQCTILTHNIDRGSTRSTYYIARNVALPSSPLQACLLY